MSDSKPNIKVVVAIIFVILAGVLIWQQFYPSVFSNKFEGQIERVEGSYVYVKGNFAIQEDVDKYKYSGEEYSKTVKILISPETELIRRYILISSVEGEGGDNTEEYKIVEETGAMEDFKNEISIKVTTAEGINVINKDELTASKVEYMVLAP